MAVITEKGDLVKTLMMCRQNRPWSFFVKAKRTPALSGTKKEGCRKMVNLGGTAEIFGPLSQDRGLFFYCLVVPSQKYLENSLLTQCEKRSNGETFLFGCAGTQAEKIFLLDYVCRFKNKKRKGKANLDELSSGVCAAAYVFSSRKKWEMTKSLWKRLLPWRKTLRNGIRMW